MPIRLELAVDNPVLSAHEGLRLRCLLSNENAPSVDVPTSYDRSGSFRVNLYSPDQVLLRIMDRVVRQRMMSNARIDASLDLDTLATGQEWDWTMDLSSFHYPIPPGAFLLDAEYQYEPLGLNLQTGQIPIRVKPDPVRAVGAWRDNPIIDSLTLILEAQGENGPAYFLRQHSTARPVGAWYSMPVLQESEPTEPFLATAAYFQTENIDLAYRKWIVWTEGAKLCARCYQDGEPDGDTRSAVLPDGATLIRSAVVTPFDLLYVFYWNASGRLECALLDSSELTSAFQHETKCPPGTAIAIGADGDNIYVGYEWRGLMCDRLSWDGMLTDRRHAVKTLNRLSSLICDPGVPRFRAIFRERGKGGLIQLAVLNLETGLGVIYAMDRLPLRDEIHELAFDQDRRGRFHMLVSTSERKLYYLSEERGPILVAEGEENFHPVVATPLKIYLGCYRREYGYRFLQYRRRNEGPRFEGAELHS